MTADLQPTLFDKLHAGVLTIQLAFIAFHSAHPGVYAELVRICRTYRQHRPGIRWSIDAAYEVLRWERMMADLPDENEDFKLNNNYRSRYARLIMEREPDLADIFETRSLRA